MKKKYKIKIPTGSNKYRLLESKGNFSTLVKGILVYEIKIEGEMLSLLRKNSERKQIKEKSIKNKRTRTSPSWTDGKNHLKVRTLAVLN